MRTAFVLSAAVIWMAASTSHASENARIAEFVKQELFKKTHVTATPIKAPSVVTCFAAAFYRVEIRQEMGGGGTSTERAIYMQTAKGVEAASKPSTNQAMPMLAKIINPRFVLKNEAAGNVMLAALKELYVRKDGFRQDVEPMVVRKGNTWNFILDDFLGKKYSGFVMTTDANGRITRVDYSLGITK